MRIALLFFVSFLFACSCRAQQQCATVSPTSVTLPSAGGYASSAITIVTTVPTGGNNCGGYAPISFSLNGPVCISVSTCASITFVSETEGGPPGFQWTFVEQIYAEPNLSCLTNTFLFPDFNGQTVTATQPPSPSCKPTCNITITPSSLPNGIVNSVYPSQTLVATGGTPPYTWTVSGLPTGLVPTPQSDQTDIISGTPTQSGPASVAVQVKDSLGCTASTTLPLSVVCKVNLTTKWSQGVNPQTSGNGPPGGGAWGNKTYNNYNPNGGNCIEGDASTNCTIQELGCVLTSLAMALKFAGVNFVNGAALDPGILNDFMKRPSHYFDSSHDVKLDQTTRALLPGKRFVFDTPSNAQTLDDVVCTKGFPEIVGVDLIGGVPNHYVLVTGKQDAEYQIVDPGDHSNTVLDTSDFVTRGHVADPVGDISGLDLALGSNAELLVIDGGGRRTGFDQASGTVLEEIPQSVHFVDSLRNDVTLTPPNGKSHSVLVFQPFAGPYTVLVTGLELGTYLLEADSFSTDGTPQVGTSVNGIASVGSSSTFQIQFGSAPNVSSTIARVASFQSALADIANSLALGLIDNAGIANALSSKIQAASSAASSGQNQAARNILNAFLNQLNAQTGKHITNVAPQVLVEDADSLISQLP